MKTTVTEDRKCNIEIKRTWEWESVIVLVNRMKLVFIFIQMAQYIKLWVVTAHMKQYVAETFINSLYKLAVRLVQFCAV